MTAVDPAWVEVCRFETLVPDRGVCALVGRHQVAVFRVSRDDGEADELFAISNYDPFSRASVLSRGIVGSRGGVPKVSSPVFKQSFELGTGTCIDDPTVAVPRFDVRVRSGIVEVRLPVEDLAAVAGDERRAISSGTA